MSKIAVKAGYNLADENDSVKRFMQITGIAAAKEEDYEDPDQTSLMGLVVNRALGIRAKEFNTEKGFKTRLNGMKSAATDKQDIFNKSKIKNMYELDRARRGYEESMIETKEIYASMVTTLGKSTAERVLSQSKFNATERAIIRGNRTFVLPKSIQ
jgi:hypothetical protein